MQEQERPNGDIMAQLKENWILSVEIEVMVPELDPIQYFHFTNEESKPQNGEMTSLWLQLVTELPFLSAVFFLLYYTISAQWDG